MRQRWTHAAGLRFLLVITAVSMITLAASTPIHSARVASGAFGGPVTTFAGTGKPSFSGDEGLALAAQLRSAHGVAVDEQENVYIADSQNYSVRKAANASTAGSSYRTYRLRWPSLPQRSATYHLRFKSLHLRAMSLRVYGKAVPRGFDFAFIVACEHRGPAVLDWNWAQTGGYVRITVKMTTGTCDLPGPTVAGTSVALTFRLVT